MSLYLKHFSNTLNKLGKTSVTCISRYISNVLKLLRNNIMSEENLTDDETNVVNRFNSNLVDSSTQTVIRVYPFFIEGVTNCAEVKSDKKIQTTLSVKQNLEDNKFYTLLRYTPFQDITEDSLRVIQIPRPRKLQFLGLPIPQNVDKKAAKFAMADDDGVGYICCEVLHHLENRTSKAYQDAEVQTDVRACPHLLDTESVATVFIDGSSQTMNCSRSKSV